MRKKSSIILVCIFFVLLVTASLFYYSNPTQTKATIEWIPTSVNAEVKAGRTKTITVTFIPAEDISGPIDVYVAPELEQFVYTTSKTFYSLTEGKQEAIEITFYSSVYDPQGIYDGTIHIRQGTSTLVKPLPIKVRINERQLITDPKGGIYPVNEILLALKEGTTITAAEDLADMVNGTFEDFDINTPLLLLEVPTTSINELKTAMDILESDPRVEFATTNNIYPPITDF